MKQGGLYDNALMAAEKGGHKNIVQILLERGAYREPFQGPEYSPISSSM